MNREISANELKALGEDITLIDVREPDEFNEVHVEGAINFPLKSFDALATAEYVLSTGRPVCYVICRSGARSKTAIEKLLAVDSSTEYVNVRSGTIGAEEVGCTTVKNLSS